MVKEINKEYLKKNQYGSTKYLDARIAIHKFTENKYSFHEWIFEKLIREINSFKIKCLDVGCGTAEFWKKNYKRLNDYKIDIVLTDFSNAMLEKTKKNTENIKFEKVVYEEAEVESLNKYYNQFDVVFCHNVIYHAENKQKATQELLKCLKNDNSILSITTNSAKHMLNVYEIGRNLDKSYPTDRIIDSFTEEIADKILPEICQFKKIVEEEVLKVDDLEIMMNYVKSHTEPRGIKLKENFFEEYTNIVKDEISKNGYFKIIKRSPLYICKQKIKINDIMDYRNIRNRKNYSCQTFFKNF